MTNFKSILIAGIISLVSVAAGADFAPLAEGKYVTVKDGHLSYDGKRIRFWGMNLCAGIKRGGSDLDLLFDRLEDIGINAIRLTLVSDTLSTGKAGITTKVPVTVKGADDQMDRMDRAIYLAKKRGIFFWMQFDMLHSKYLPGDYDVLPDNGRRAQWNALIKERISRSHLVYVNERAAKVHMEYAKSMLNHINPYTGKRWGDEETFALWEVFNESLFVRAFTHGGLWARFPLFVQQDVTSRWNDWLRNRYKDDDTLRKRWGSLRDGETLTNNKVIYMPFTPSGGTNILWEAKWGDQAGAPIEIVQKGKVKWQTLYSRSRGEDVVHFACFLYQDYHRRFKEVIRTQGRGIAQVPIFPSGNFERTFAQYYAGSEGDVTAGGVYSFAPRPWEVAKDDPLYPFQVRLNHFPSYGQPVDITRMADKPYLLYECNAYRRDPYRVELPMRIALMLIQQDADGAFWFNWDSKGYLRNLACDQDYATNKMPMADANYPNACLVLATDEVMLAAIKSAGEIFKSGCLPPPANPVEVRLGSDVIFNPDGKMGNLESWLRYAFWQGGINLHYDPSSPTSTLPPLPPTSWPTSIKVGPYVEMQWGKKRGTLRIDSPSIKAQVGFNGPDIEFGTTKVAGINRDYSSICIVSEGGKSLEESSSIVITMVADSRNTGLKFDASRMKKKWMRGMAQATVNPGRAPVIVDRVSGTITAPWLKGRWYRKYDFARRCYEEGPISTSLTITAREPLFYAQIFSKKPKLPAPVPPHVYPEIKKVLFVGNSITLHPPWAKIDWKYNCGMAATSKKNDFVHQLYKMLCNNLKGKIKPTFKIGKVKQENKMKGWEHISTGDIDLIIIELGDNYRGKASSLELQLPYEKMINGLKGKRDPIIVCVSTWGNPKRNSFIRKAAKNQGALYVDLQRIFAKSKNRAVGGEFTNRGVQWHPNNRGMQAIAVAIWKVLQPELAKRKLLKSPSSN
jgi:hypothetical protein